LTKSTETTPTEFQVGDKVIITDKLMGNYGREGEIVGLKENAYDYRVSVAGIVFSYDHGELELVKPAGSKPADDPVSHPSHYTQYPVEVIELTRHMPFCDGNVVKYVARSPFKGNRLQDLKKARWYLEDAIAEEEKKQENAK
jgi:hypothetical protein